MNKEQKVRHLKVAVAVLNYNGKHHLKRCFETLMKQSYTNYDVYMIDNGSSDGSIDYVRENFPWVKILALKRNYGFAEAYNKAVKILDNYEYIAFLNNDVEVDENWLLELIKTFLNDKNKNIVAVGSKILLYDQRNVINHAGGKITIIGAGIDIGLFEEDKNITSSPIETGFTCGGAMCVRRDLFLKLGGFDPDYFIFFEDVDFCWRAWLLGYKVLHVPTSIVYHKYGGTVGRRLSFERLRLTQRNRLMTMLKNVEISMLWEAILISFLYDFFRMIDFLKCKRLKEVFIISSAYWWIIKNIRKILKKRKIVQRQRVISTKYLCARGLIASLSEGLIEYKKARKELYDQRK